MHGCLNPVASVEIAEPTVSDYFNEQNKRYRDIVGESHKLGFCNNYLHGCLYVYAGGGKMGNSHTKRYLRQLGLLTEDENLTFLGGRVLRFLHHTSTAKPYLWAQDLAKDKKSLAATLKPLDLVLA